MIPFVVAGGILIALSFAIGGPQVSTQVNGGTFHGVSYPGVKQLSQVLQQVGVAGLLCEIGSTAFSMLVPILAGFIAFGMADHPGIAPGIVGGLLANAIGAGFLGGIVAGLPVGRGHASQEDKTARRVRTADADTRLPDRRIHRGGRSDIVVLGQPIASAMDSLQRWLKNLQGANAILLGVILGAMMAFDMGGPGTRPPTPSPSQDWRAARSDRWPR